ncbi:MAG: F0F1 ATP synthase subunit delta [Acutalibacteraceae bacterium]|nr:F0F1 ATP synthase subunit delta [Acutalibacteraceae bacterium]
MKKAIITVASNMSDKTYERICNGFAEKLGEVSFEKVTDDRIIGGFIAEIDGQIFDMSIASQIAKMQKQISN